MRRMIPVAIVLACGLARAAGPPTFPIYAASYTDPRQFEFLGEVMKRAEVVSLAESIHMTHEFPLVRLGIIRYLNENQGFDVLAMEGSAVDIWATQDRFLNSSRTPADAVAAQLGLFALWNTAEIREVFEYAIASWSSKSPLYITAYDIQPGTGKGVHGTAAFKLLLERLRTYATPPEGFDSGRWVDDLAPLTGACHDYRAADRARVEAAIQLLEPWIARSQPEIAKRLPNLPHAVVLGLIPENLRASLALCEGRTEKTWREYKSTRDTQATKYVLRLKEVVPGQKLMLWAHISHLSHNSLANGTSVGQLVRREIGDRLYTVGVFAEAGGAILIYDDTKDDVGYGRVHADRSALGRLLSRTSGADYFMDLRESAQNPAADPLLVSRELLWAESGTWPMQLARDFDGIVWIKTVHAPGLPMGQLVLFSSLHYIRELEIAGGVVLVGAAGLVVYRMKRLRRIKRRVKIRGSKGRVL
jgi:erythromycin esterase-like protein